VDRHADIYPDRHPGQQHGHSPFYAHDNTHCGGGAGDYPSECGAA
jgi:hypothetical protein